MANIAAKRIEREFKEVERSEEGANGTFILKFMNNTWTDLKGEISGPIDTPYEGGRYVLDIKIPENYPFRPPTVRFVTKVWHPNISSVTGAVCLDILKNEWAAAMTLRTILLSLQALLSAAEPTDPQDAVVASQFIREPEMYKRTARHWASVFAGSPHRDNDCETKIKRLIEMGVDEHDARISLSNCDWVLEKATEKIFSLT